ncbi:hydrogenase expression/formation protein HypE [Paenibacillus sp. SEL3]|uniref:Hydrogenase expression/formation protein HypE n=1 Tax=Paenibacillus polymyxa TaxID=1406 RepID=A0A8I1IYH6_PAEPO|nr:MULTISPECIES: hydrogenase expression/formation protein HypE [Paenibacillus]KAF6575296.1 hydrogenase expression/formation protein HypE [Paenibacillus sp. EKM206P]KAF6590031.1 hydrogenase expression/formation protein HypE [Paenibacillus sp. EKM205P]MBM0632625.1 hydrogenase expression/formation protein HypE [Paenibacillus polymyxa]
MQKIVISHGDGGRMTHDLIQQVFLRYFKDPVLLEQSDAAIISVQTPYAAVSTDSFVIQPLEFPGGDIGKLAVAGTVNDLAVSGVKPAFLTVGFILEEGLEISFLQRIVHSLAVTAAEAGVRIIAGDTKVVEKGSCGGMIINTTGIGYMEKPNRIAMRNIRPGDVIVINGGIAEHAVAILAKRAGLEFSPGLLSDCCALNGVVDQLLDTFKTIRFMRDPSRGGIATSLKEIAEHTELDMVVEEKEIPLRLDVQGAIEMMGMDPLYMANEGKVLIFVAEEEAAALVQCLKSIPGYETASEIGRVKEGTGRVLLQTMIGGTRELDRMSGNPLPRIC